MDISLHPKHVAFIEKQIQLGRYSSADALMNEVVALLRSLCEREEYAAEVEKQIQADAAQSKASQTTDGEQVFDRPQQKLDSGLSLEEMRKMIGTDKPA